MQNMKLQNRSYFPILCFECKATASTVDTVSIMDTFKFEQNKTGFESRAEVRTPRGTADTAP